MKKVMKKYIVPHEDNDFRPHLLRSAGLFVLITAIAVVFLASQAQRISLPASDYLASVLPAVLADLANHDRASNQLASLSVNPMLQEAARLKAEDMATKGYFAHHSPSGVSPWYWISQSGYGFTYAGENLAVNFDDSDAVNTAWMNSPTHRANILNNRFTEIGIATSKGIYEGGETTFVVQMFGRPMLKPTASKSAESPSAVVVSNLSLQGESAGNKNEKVSGSEISVTELASSSTASESGNQTFVAVENSGTDVASASAGAVSGAEIARYSSLWARFVTSPTKTLAVVYLAISALLLAGLLSVLFVKHNRRVRHVIIIITLLILLCGIFYAYRAFVHSEVVVTTLF